MGHSIYIADDEANIRELIKSFLESDGYTVSAFATGDELAEAFEKEHADLVILDIMMRPDNYSDRQGFRIRLCSRNNDRQ